MRRAEPEQLDSVVPGTYGSILDTQRHFIGGDAGYLFYLTGDRTHAIDDERMGLAELRGVMERNGAAWSRFLAEGLDPDAVVREVDEDDGYQRDAPIGIRLAQALHHGSDHRSQICTALTALGVEPPDIDVWDFGVANGRVIEVPPTS
ncbi:MAG: DinB family protein [Candidatus Limnocylindria bacterium]